MANKIAERNYQLYLLEIQVKVQVYRLKMRDLQYRESWHKRNFLWPKTKLADDIEEQISTKEKNSGKHNKESYQQTYR